MSAVTTPATAIRPAGAMRLTGDRKLWGDTWLLFKRGVKEGIRNPVFAFIFPTLFPLFMIALTSQLFKAVVLLPGFPVKPYAAYETPAVVLQAAVDGRGAAATA